MTDKVELCEGILEVARVLGGGTEEVSMWRAGVKHGVAQRVRETGEM